MKNLTIKLMIVLTMATLSSTTFAFRTGQFSAQFFAKYKLMLAPIVAKGINDIYTETLQKPMKLHVSRTSKCYRQLKQFKFELKTAERSFTVYNHGHKYSDLSIANQYQRKATHTLNSLKQRCHARVKNPIKARYYAIDYKDLDMVDVKLNQIEMFVESASLSTASSQCLEIHNDLKRYSLKARDYANAYSDRGSHRDIKTAYRYVNYAKQNLKALVKKGCHR